MAFVAVLPAVGSAVLPALGTVATGLGAAASSIPVVGSTLGAIGSGLGGGLTALGAGNLAGAASSLGSGILGAGSNVLSGLGGIYGGADKLLGGLLPNMGIAGTVTPSAGWLGQGGLGLLGNPAAGAMQGPHIPLSDQFSSFLGGGAPVSGANIQGALGQMGIAPAAGGAFSGLLGTLGKVGQAGAVLNTMRGGQATAPGVNATGINTRPVNEEKEDIKQNGGQVGATSSVNLAPSESYSPMAPSAGGGPLQYNDALSIDRLGPGTGGLLDLIQNMQDPRDTDIATARSLGAVYGSRPTTMA